MRALGAQMPAICAPDIVFYFISLFIVLLFIYYFVIYLS